MKILSCSVYNFLSYKHLEFKFTGQGLCLISGATGSGKSTLCDIAVWAMFGRTSKNGAVNEVLSWPGDKVTSVKLVVNVGEYPTTTICRTRGPQAKDNDLYFSFQGSPIRGKDLVDSQKLLNDHLGIDLDLFLSGSYFHEFSQTAQFFVATAKNRRQLTEQLVDLSLPITLTEKMTGYRKEIKTELSTLQDKLNVTTGVIKSLNSTIAVDVQREKRWQASHDGNIKALTVKRDEHKSSRAKQIARATKEHQSKLVELESELLELKKSMVSTMDIAFYRATLAEDKRQLELVKGRKCPTCGSSVGKDNAVALMQREHELDRMELGNENKKKLIELKTKEISQHVERKVEATVPDENPYEKQLAAMVKEENPYTGGIEKRVEEVQGLSTEAADLSNTMTDFKREHADIEILLDVVSTFRSVLIKNTVVDLENNTNKILTEYFDSEIRVKFDLADSDKLEVTIWKDGNEAVFTQLSKGQRQLLKLSFSISVMKCVANHHGVDFNAIFLDEALDGLDESLKVKAYALLESLATEHESVFVVEHSNELKAMFTNRYDVELTDEGSQLAEAI